MTLASIMKLALRQLDEPAEDLAEYDELFRNYANMGYMIATREYLKPREIIELHTDERGFASLEGLCILRVVEAMSDTGVKTAFLVSSDGRNIQTPLHCMPLFLLCEIECPPMMRDMDEPMLPEYAQPALADYICYRYLSCGSLAKQSRAEFFRSSFYQQMHMLYRHGRGSVTGRLNLYEATR